MLSRQSQKVIRERTNKKQKIKGGVHKSKNVKIEESIHIKRPKTDYKIMGRQNAHYGETKVAYMGFYVLLHVVSIYFMVDVVF